MKRKFALALIASLAVMPAGMAAASDTDGVYTASSKGFGGDVTAVVTLENGVITSVELEGPDETPEVGGAALEALSEQFVSAGNADIDGVAGASFTSSAAKMAVQSALDEANGVQAEPVSFTPGTYTVTAQGHNSSFDVSVTFSEDKIEQIEVGDNLESHSIGDTAMSELTEIILEKQSLNVDALSGATVSSKGFLAAVTTAVEEAGGNPGAMMEPTQEEMATPENETVDVVVVGGGAAGLAATVEAYQQGLSVILVEQMDILGGSSGRAGYVFAADTVIHEQLGIDYSVQDLLDEYDLTDPRAAAFEEQTSKDVDWLVENGVQFGSVNLNAQVYGPDGKRVGAYLVDDMKAYLDGHDIDYRLSTRADHLLVDDSGKVCGISAVAPNGESYEITAEAVVLSTGGYFGNAEMTEQYFPGWGSNPFDCSVGADGSGMLMAEAVGAELAGMDYANFHAIAGYYNGASRSLTMVAGNGGIAVNQDGERFFNEAGDYTEFTYAADEQERVIAIFDQTVADLDAVSKDIGCSATWEMYTICDTLDEIAEAFDLDPAALQATVENYQQGVETGEDSFGKAAANMRSDLSTAPYYAVETLIENHTTYGGIVTADNTQALNAEGEPIEGLYAAGECTQKKDYMKFNLGAAVYEGREAIRTILAER